MTRGTSVRVALLLSTMLACGGQAAVSKPLDGVQQDSVQVPTMLSGHLLGHDGKPMAQAHIHVGGSSHQIADDGSFRVEVDQPFVRATFTGVDHAEVSIGIATADGGVDLDVQLGTYPRPAELAELSLATYLMPIPEGEVPGSTALWPMVKDADGVYTATIKSELDQIGYHVVGLAVNRNINGPQSDSYVYDNGGDYISVVRVTDGLARIRVDPRELAPGGESQKVTFAKPESTAARVAHVFLDGDHSGYADENNDWVRSAKLLAFLSSPAAATDRDTALEVTQRVIEEIPADSPLWVMAPNALFAIAVSAERGPAYAEKVAAESKDRDTAARILIALLFRAEQAGDVEALRRLRNTLKEDFADTPYASQADRFDPDRKVMAGKRLPDFDYEEWGGQRRVSRASLEGKEVVVKFWATWCKPCIAEMDKLHKLWEENKGGDFALVSICVNDSAEAFEKFRKDQWPMPWTNIFLDGTQSAEAMTMWEVVGIPKTIHANGGGIITDVQVGGAIE